MDPDVKIRLFQDCLIFKMGISIPQKDVFLDRALVSMLIIGVEPVFVQVTELIWYSTTDYIKHIAHITLDAIIFY